MELQEFVKTAIKAIGKGIQEGKEGNIVPGDPLIGKDYGKGVEFDLLVVTDEKGEIHIKDYPTKDVTLSTRINFCLPITVKK